VQTHILAESFEGLNSCLAQLAGELWSCEQDSKNWDFTKNYQPANKQNGDF